MSLVPCEEVDRSNQHKPFSEGSFNMLVLYMVLHSVVTPVLIRT